MQNNGFRTLTSGRFKEKLAFHDLPIDDVLITSSLGLAFLSSIDISDSSLDRSTILEPSTSLRNWL